jgi:hypothetical protein
MISRKSIAFGTPASLAADTNVSVQPHIRVPLPATTAIPGKHTPGNEHSQIDRRTLEAETSGSSLQESYNPQPREEVSGARRPFDVQIPEASPELPPVYSPV